MSDQTANLALPYILPSQAQKHVTHNEALQRLDAAVQLTIHQQLTAPPATPAEGDCYLVLPDATAAWAGKDGQLAMRQDAAWLYLSPKNGWCALFRESGDLRSFDGATWQAISLRSDQSVAMIGVNAAPDNTNRLAVSSPASLFSHEGHGHQLKLNKAAVGETGTILFQTGWAGRAELGLAGNDDFSIKVSSDGSSWKTALRISGTGIVETPERPAAAASRTAGTATPASGSLTGFDALRLLQGSIQLGTTVPSGSGQRLIVPSAGLYILSLNVRTLSSSGHGAAIEANGATVLAALEGQSSASPARQSVAALARLEAGDWLALRHTGTALYEFGESKTELAIALL